MTTDLISFCADSMSNKNCESTIQTIHKRSFESIETIKPFSKITEVKQKTKKKIGKKHLERMLNYLGIGFQCKCNNSMNIQFIFIFIILLILYLKMY